MRDTIEQVKNFLQNYSRVWDNQIYLEQELAEPEISKPEQAGKKVIIPSKTTQKGITQKSPELQKYFLEIKDCTKCALASSRNNFVFGFGNPQAQLMFIGEAPGKAEDEQGIPFVGRAGQLFDKILHAIGLNRDQIYIANMLKCRPPQNRDPLPDEIIKCEPYLHHQLTLIKPKILVALGRVSGQNLLKRESSLSALREQVHSYKETPLIVTYHPAALLRNPRWKQNSWQDFKKIKKILQDT